MMEQFEKQLKIKEFEKWSGKTCKNGNCPVRSGHEISCTACENLQEKGWRAALKWVLEDTEYTGDHGESIIDQNIIRKELGDKTYDQS